MTLSSLFHNRSTLALVTSNSTHQQQHPPHEPASPTPALPTQHPAVVVTEQGRSTPSRPFSSSIDSSRIINSTSNSSTTSNTNNTPRNNNNNPYRTSNSRFTLSFNNLIHRTKNTTSTRKPPTLNTSTTQHPQPSSPNNTHHQQHSSPLDNLMQFSLGPSPPTTPIQQHIIPAASSSAQQQQRPSTSSQQQHQQHQQQPQPQQQQLLQQPSSKSTYFPGLRRIQSRRKEPASTLSTPSNATQDADRPPPPPLPHQQQHLSHSANAHLPPQPQPSRSISQPPPIPRALRSATERLRISHHHRTPSSHSVNPDPIPTTAAPPPQPPPLNQSMIRNNVNTNPNNSTTNDQPLPAPTANNNTNDHSAAANSNNSTTQSQSTAMFSLRLVPHLDASRSLHFDPIERKLSPSMSLKLGRFTDRGTPQSNSDSRIAFKSKVVSRGHADIFTDHAGSFFIKDTKSSSGTFLNHIRLSAPGGESRPFPLRDGDVLQLGVDYQGGTEEIYRCVKMRVELNRGWQRSANAFNQQALAQLRSLGAKGTATTTTNALAVSATKDKVSCSNPPSGEVPKAVSDCCICLFGVTVCQALFIAPCSHTYHYKCIRPLLQMHHPGFSCPLCRTFADLEADVETDDQPVPAAPSPEAVAVNLAPPSAAAAGHQPSPPPDSLETTRPPTVPQQSERVASAAAAAADEELENLANGSGSDGGLGEQTVIQERSPGARGVLSVQADRAHTMVMTSEMAAAYRANMAAHHHLSQVASMGSVDETAEEEARSRAGGAPDSSGSPTSLGEDPTTSSSSRPHQQLPSASLTSSSDSHPATQSRRLSDNVSLTDGLGSSVASDDLSAVPLPAQPASHPTNATRIKQAKPSLVVVGSPASLSIAHHHQHQQQQPSSDEHKPAAPSSAIVAAPPAHSIVAQVSSPDQLASDDRPLP